MAISLGAVQFLKKNVMPKPRNAFIFWPPGKEIAVLTSRF